MSLMCIVLKASSNEPFSTQFDESLSFPSSDYYIHIPRYVHCTLRYLKKKYHDYYVHGCNVADRDVDKRYVEFNQ